MPTPTTQLIPEDAPSLQAPSLHAPDASYYRQALHGLIDFGGSFARILHDQAAELAAQPSPSAAPHPAAHPAQHPAARPEAAQQLTPAAPTPGAPKADTLIKLAAAFDDVSRNVRRCILLADDLNQPRKQPKAAYAAASDAEPSPEARTAARKRILRAVQDTIQRRDYDGSASPECDPPETQRRELLDRLDAPDLDTEIATRPVEDIIKDILRDLGLAALPGTRPWQRRTPADTAELNARAAAPCRPEGATPHEAPGPNPQDGHPAEQHSAQPGPGPDQQGPDGQSTPPKAARRQPGPFHTNPTHPGLGLPEDPAEAVAFVLRYAADPRWQPPLEI